MPRSNTIEFELTQLQGHWLYVYSRAATGCTSRSLPLTPLPAPSGLVSNQGFKLRGHARMGNGGPADAAPLVVARRVSNKAR